MEIPKFTYKISQLVPNDLFCFIYFRYEEKRLIFFDDVIIFIFISFVIHMLILAI